MINLNIIDRYNSTQLLNEIIDKLEEECDLEQLNYKNEIKLLRDCLNDSEYNKHKPYILRRTITNWGRGKKFFEKSDPLFIETQKNYAINVDGEIKKQDPITGNLISTGIKLNFRNKDKKYPYWEC